MLSAADDQDKAEDGIKSKTSCVNLKRHKQILQSAL